MNDKPKEDRVLTAADIAEIARELEAAKVLPRPCRECGAPVIEFRRPLAPSTFMVPVTPAEGVLCNECEAKESP